MLIKCDMTRISVKTSDSIEYVTYRFTPTIHKLGLKPEAEKTLLGLPDTDYHPIPLRLPQRDGQEPSDSFSNGVILVEEEHMGAMS